LTYWLSLNLVEAFHRTSTNIEQAQRGSRRREEAEYAETGEVRLLTSAATAGFYNRLTCLLIFPANRRLPEAVPGDPLG